MNRQEQQLLLLELLDRLAAHGSWCGETHVQKCAYFLQEGLCVPSSFDFILYKHGPFSFDLRGCLGEMRATLLIGVTPRRPYGASLSVSDSGRAWLIRASDIIGTFSTHIEFVSERLASKGVVDLERLGTALYVIRNRPELSIDKQIEEVASLKPHISYEQARGALADVDHLLADAGQTVSA